MGIFLDFFLKMLIIDKNLGSTFSIGNNIRGLALLLIIGKFLNDAKDYIIGLIIYF